MVNKKVIYEQFFKDAYEKINQEVVIKFNFHGLTSNLRGNVMELPVSTIRGCHYEIGFHKDCHEIALHFQGSVENNLARSESFRSLLPGLEVKLGYPLLLEPFEGKKYGRKRLWIKLPISDLSTETLDKYTDLMANLIVETFPILQVIIQKEHHS